MLLIKSHVSYNVEVLKVVTHYAPWFQLQYTYLARSDQMWERKLAVSKSGQWDHFGTIPSKAGPLTLTDK